MEQDWIYLSEELGIPGLSVVRGPIEGEDESYLCEYEPTGILACPKKNCDGWGQRAGWASDTRTIYDLESEDPLKIRSLRLRHRRITCSRCGKEIPYDPPFSAKGVKTTARLDGWITEQSLHNSPEKVAEKLGGVVSPAQVSVIFKRTSDEKIGQYTSLLAAPKQAGINLHVFRKERIIALTCLDNQYILDVFKANDPDILKYLLNISAEKRTTDCVTDIDISCIVPARGTIGTNQNARIRACISSIYREMVSTYEDVFRANYKGQRLGIILEILKTPFSEQIHRTDINNVNNLLYTDTGSKRRLLQALFKAYVLIRHRMRENWNSQDYSAWKNDVSATALVPDLTKTLDIADREIQNSFFQTDLQGRNDEIKEQVETIVARSTKCSFDTMRRRILLTCKPKTVEIEANGVKRMHFAGVSLFELCNALPEYNK